MKKITKIALTAALCLIVLGGICCAIGLGIGYTFSELDRELSEDFSFGSERIPLFGRSWGNGSLDGSQEQFEFPWEDVENLELDIGGGTVEIMPTDGDTLRVSVERPQEEQGTIQTRLKDGTLKIEEQGDIYLDVDASLNAVAGYRNVAYHGESVTDSHDAAEHDADSHDAEEYDAEDHEADGHDVEEHEADSHDAAEHDADSHDVAEYDAEEHEADGHDVEEHEADGRQDAGSSGAEADSHDVEEHDAGSSGAEADSQGSVGSEQTGASIILEVPYEMTADGGWRNISISQGAGTLSIGTPLAAQKISIDLGIGACLFQKELAAGQKIEGEAAAGQLVVADMKAEKIELSVGAGEFVSGRIDAKKIEMECGSGKIAMEVSGAEADYDYEVECGIGEVEIGGNSYGGFWAGKEVKNPGSSRKMEIDCGIGEVKVDFCGETE